MNCVVKAHSKLAVFTWRFSAVFTWATVNSYPRTHGDHSKPKNTHNYDLKPKLSPQVFHSLGKAEESSELEVVDLKQTERMTLLLRKG
jgi:hypothetical protein